MDLSTWEGRCGAVDMRGPLLWVRGDGSWIRGAGV